MDVARQIRDGRWVCPRTRQRLTTSEDGQWLRTADGGARYRLRGGRGPILLPDETQMGRLVADADRPLLSEDPARLNDRILLRRTRERGKDGYRSQASIAAYHRLLSNATDDSLCLSIGGGPSRPTRFAWNLPGDLVRPLDRSFNHRQNAHVLATILHVLAMR